MEHVFIRIKNKAVEIGLTSTDLRHGISIFLGLEKFDITDVIETKADILKVPKETLDKLAAVFAYAKIYQVEFYVADGRVRMRKVTKPLDKKTYEELTGIKSPSSTWQSMFQDFFKNK